MATVGKGVSVMQVAGVWLPDGTIDVRAGVRAAEDVGARELLRRCPVPDFAGWVWDRPGEDPGMFWETYPQLEDLSDRLADLDDGGAALEFLASAGDGVEAGYLDAVTETVRRWLEQMPRLLESTGGSWLYGWDARPAGRCYAIGAKFGGREELAGEYLDWLRFASFVPAVWDSAGVYPLDQVSLAPPDAVG